MRVCHVIESSAAGSGGVMLTLAERGAASGQDVTVVYSPTRASEQFVERARQAALEKLISLPMHRSVGISDIAAVANFREILAQGCFDVVHSHSSKAGAVARLAGAGGHSAQIYSPHGFVTMAPGASRIYQIAEQGLSRLCDSVVAVSEKEKQHALSVGIDHTKISVIPNGIPEELVSASRVPSRAGGLFRIGFVGRLCEQKNPLLAVSAFASFRKSFPNCRLTMIGGGELDQAVNDAIVHAGIEPHVDVMGSCAALPWYETFDVLLCTSRYEGMPLTFLEAMANGLPIVSTDVGGADELIRPGLTGIVSDGAPSMLAEALGAIASSNAEGRDNYKKHCLATARSFSAQRMCDRTYGLYRANLERRKRKRGFGERLHKRIQQSFHFDH